MEPRTLEQVTEEIKALMAEAHALVAAAKPEGVTLTSITVEKSDECECEFGIRFKGWEYATQPVYPLNLTKSYSSDECDSLSEAIKIAEHRGNEAGRGW